jgi:serine/threonine protein kinase
MVYIKKDYRLKEVIGKGTYGEVFRAKHRVTKAQYAVKYLKNFMSEEGFQISAYREIYIMKELTKMKGCNVFTTKIHEVVLAGDEEDFKSLFIVMDYMPQDMRMMLTNKSLLYEQDHALITVYNLLCALNFLHTANVIHRDIKPSNILMN